MMTVQRSGALVFVLGFAVLSIGADNCNPWAPDQVSNGAADCCPAGSQHYVCSAQVQVTNMQLMSEPGPGSEVRCFAPPSACASSVAEAEKSVQAAAQVFYAEAATKIVAVQALQCSPVGGCVQGGGGLNPQDYPGACNMIEVAGAGTGAGGGTPASCGMELDGCTQDSDCCSGICALNACQLADSQREPPHEHLGSGAGGAGGAAP